MDLNRSRLAAAEDLLRTEVSPRAAEIDRHPDALRSALQTLGNASLLALRVPDDWGGAGLNEATFRHFQELVARYSGALAFLQAQHQSAGALLSRSDNTALKQAYLPKMATGAALVGISFAHLRRDNPPVKAIAVPGGYEINGQSPWVTGWGFFQTFIVAALLPDDRAVYGMVPFATEQQPNGGTLVCSEPLPLAAMNSTATVTVQFQRWFLPQAQVVGIYPASAVSKNDRLNVLQHSFFALGCARAGLDILESANRSRPSPVIHTVYESLAQELDECRSAIFAAPSGGEQFEANLQLRAWAIELAVRCAHAAVTVSSGSANSSHHPAQRIYREALMFTVSGQTTAVMEATLTRLMR